MGTPGAQEQEGTGGIHGRLGCRGWLEAHVYPLALPNTVLGMAGPERTVLSLARTLAMVRCWELGHGVPRPCMFCSRSCALPVVSAGAETEQRRHSQGPPAPREPLGVGRGVLVCWHGDTHVCGAAAWLCTPHGWAATRLDLPGVQRAHLLDVLILPEQF